MKALLPLIAAGALAGCASSTDGPLAPSFGAALASMDAQIIDPRPAEGPIESSAARAGLGLKRYEQHKVIEPAGAYTEKSVGGGSGDSSGGAGKDGAGKDGDSK